jgi:hypothetical protein
LLQLPQDKIEAQEKKISSLELSRKLTTSTGSEPMAKKLMELQVSKFIKLLFFVNDAAKK